jgi:hypothetical protein
MISRLRAWLAHLRCETCLSWTSQVFIRNYQPPRDEVCPACGRRVPLRLIWVYHLVELHASEAEKSSTA